MSKDLKNLLSGLQILEDDIIQGVESKMVAKLPGWKIAMVSYEDFLILRNH